MQNLATIFRVMTISTRVKRAISAHQRSIERRAELEMERRRGAETGIELFQNCLFKINEAANNGCRKASYTAYSCREIEFQCRRTGDYELGRAFFEGKLNVARQLLKKARFVVKRREHEHPELHTTLFLLDISW